MLRFAVANQRRRCWACQGGVAGSCILTGSVTSVPVFDNIGDSLRSEGGGFRSGISGGFFFQDAED